CAAAVPLRVQHHTDDVHGLKLLKDPAGRKRRLPAGHQDAQAGHAALELLELADVRDDRREAKILDQPGGAGSGRGDEHAVTAEGDDVTAALLGDRAYRRE